jgi:ABC-type branched-subunit amino acid transport system substrate-binding protein
MRFALLPLTLKAKSAALNWVLLQNSFQTANNLLDQIKQQQGSAAGVGSDRAQQAAKGLAHQQQQQTSVEQLKRPSKLKLVRSYYRYFRKQQKTTSMWWWVTNAAVQVSFARMLLDG